MQKILSVVAGIVLLFVILVAVQMFAPLLHPIPAGTKAGDPAALAQWMSTAPLAAQAVVVLAWFLSAFGAAWVALRISGWAPAAWGIALIGVVLAVANVLRFEHPLWMQIAAVAAPLLGGWLAIRASARAPAAESIDG